MPVDKTRHGTPFRPRYLLFPRIGLLKEKSLAQVAEAFSLRNWQSSFHFGGSGTQINMKRVRTFFENARSRRQAAQQRSRKKKEAEVNR